MLIFNIGCITNEPEPDITKWIDYETIFDNIRFSYKIPTYKKDTMEGKQVYGIESFVEKFDDKNHHDFLAIYYDYGYDFRQFELILSLVEYLDRKFIKIPEEELFIKNHLDYLKRKNKSFIFDTVEIKNKKALHLKFYRDQQKQIINTEIYCLPLTKKYYLNVIAIYGLNMVEKSKEWLEARQKIFKDFFRYIQIYQIKE